MTKKPHPFYLSAGARNVRETNRSMEPRQWARKKPHWIERTLEWCLTFVVFLLIVTYALGLDDLATP